MARPINTAALTPHPAVGENRSIQFMYGHNVYCADVTCPHCKLCRWMPCGTLRQQLLRPNYTGACLRCSTIATRNGLKRAMKREGRESRWSTGNGYIMVGVWGVDEADVPLYKTMLNKGTANGLLEHRWVVAKHLGRPLESYECVDHMDGIKTNNALHNLRLYLRGKQQPGSCPGYGTYYHEWQMAEAKIRQLQSAIS